MKNSKQKSKGRETSLDWTYNSVGDPLASFFLPKVAKLSPDRKNTEDQDLSERKQVNSEYFVPFHKERDKMNRLKSTLTTQATLRTEQSLSSTKKLTQKFSGIFSPESRGLESPTWSGFSPKKNNTKHQEAYLHVNAKDSLKNLLDSEKCLGPQNEGGHSKEGKIFQVDWFYNGETQYEAKHHGTYTQRLRTKSIKEHSQNSERIKPSVAFTARGREKGEGQIMQKLLDTPGSGNYDQECYAKVKPRQKITIFNKSPDAAHKLKLLDHMNDLMYDLPSPMGKGKAGVPFSKRLERGLATSNDFKQKQVHKGTDIKSIPGMMNDYFFQRYLVNKYGLNKIRMPLSLDLKGNQIALNTQGMNIAKRDVFDKYSVYKANLGQ